MSLKRLWFLAVLLLLVSVQIVTAQDYTEEEGTIDADNPEVLFEIDLFEGETVIITVEALSGDLDPILQLLDEDENLIDENDDIDPDAGNYNSELEYTVEYDGLFLVVVTSFDNTEGDFLLTITYDEGEFEGEEEGEESFEGEEGEEDEDRPELDFTLETEHFLIHYNEDGDDAVDGAYLDAAAEIVEQVWQVEIEELGWAPPPTDEGAGGDDRFDMYLMNLCSDDEALYGYAQPEGEEGDNPNSPGVEEKGGSSFLVVDNDFDDDCFSEGEGDLLTTVAHEFHHNIQFGYDVEDIHAWYYEATATWMETQVAGMDQQATIYVSSLYETPEVCFGSPEGDLPYGTYLFIQSLVDAHGDQIVLELWENIAQYEGFEALDVTLAEYDEDIPTAVARYALSNLLLNYPLSEDFGVTVWLENTIDDVGDWSYSGDGIQELGVNYFAVDLEAANYSAYINGSENTDLSLFAIGIVEGDSADVYLLDSNSVFTTDGYDYVYLMIFNWVFDDDLEDCEFLTDYDITVEDSEDDTSVIVETLDASSFVPLGE